jgi:hypothetical protein
MNEFFTKEEKESTIPTELVCGFLETLVKRGNHFGVIEIHIERKIVRIKNRQTFAKADLEAIIKK